MNAIPEPVVQSYESAELCLVAACQIINPSTQ